MSSGLPLRGDGNENDGNLQQVLRMKAKEDLNLCEWLKRKENVYTSPEIQNEVMGIHLLRDMAEEFRTSPFLTIMADETMDVSNVEQVTLFIRWVTFNQPGYKIYRTVETLLLKACKSEELESDLMTFMKMILFKNFCALNFRLLVCTFNSLKME